MAARTPVDQYRRYESLRIALGVPEHYGVGARLLDYWRGKGWLGRPGGGPRTVPVPPAD